MMQLPRLVIYTFVLAFIVLCFLVLKELSFYFVPSVFGALLAMLMLPVNRKLEKWRVPRALAIIISLLVILSVVIVVAILFITQVVGFAKDLPTIQQQLSTKFQDMQHYIASRTGFGIDSQMEFFDKELNSVLQSADKWATNLLVSTGGTLAGMTIMIVHFFLFLLYRGRIKAFFMQILPAQGQEKGEHVIEQIAKVTQQYLTGVVTVMAILAVMNSIGFIVLGIKNAIFFGILAAVLNVIPYIGVWIGTLLPFLMALITKDSLFYPLGVLIVIIFNQFIDNNFLTPRITGSQVKINALATIGVILIGSVVWGVAGMILFIPLLGMLKIVFDNVKELKPFGYLIGDDERIADPKLARLLKRVRKK